MSSMYDYYVWFLRCSINQQRHNWAVKYIWAEHKVMIRLSSVKKWGIHLNVVYIISNVL